MGENQVTHEHHHFYHGGKKVASTSVTLSEQGTIEDVKVIDHNPSKAVSFFDAQPKYASYSDRISKLKSKIHSLPSEGSRSTPLSKEEDKLRKKLKQQKKEIESLTKEVKCLQTSATRSISSQSPLLIAKEAINDEILSDVDYSTYTIKRYLTSLKQGNYGSTLSEQKTFLDTINYIESKVERIISDKNTQIEKHVAEKIDAERKSKILESERDFSRRELDQREKDLEMALKERERIGKSLSVAEEDVARLQKTLEQMARSNEEEAELNQRMIEKIVEKDRVKMRKKISTEYQKEVEEFKHYITELATEIQSLKETQGAREKEISEVREESNLSKLKCQKLSGMVEKVHTIAARQKSNFEELKKTLDEKIPSLQDMAKGSQLFMRMMRDYEELEGATKMEEIQSNGSDLEKIRSHLRAAIERERKLEDDLTFTINLNQIVNKELENSKKMLSEIDSSISRSSFVEKSSTYKKKIEQYPQANIASKVSCIVELCDEFSKLNTSLREKVKSIQANNDLLSQELSQLHTSQVETSTNQKLFKREKESILVELNDLKQREKEMQRKVQQDAENFTKINTEQQNVIDRFKELNELLKIELKEKEEKISKLQREIQGKEEDLNGKYKFANKSMEEVMEKLERLQKEKKEIEDQYQGVRSDLEDVVVECEKKETIINQLKTQLSKATNEYLSKVEESGIMLDNEKEKFSRLEDSLASQIQALRNEVVERDVMIQNLKDSNDMLESSVMELQRDREFLQTSSQDNVFRVKDIERVVIEKEKVISEKDKIIKEKETLIVEKQAALIDLQNQLEVMKNSLETEKSANKTLIKEQKKTISEREFTIEEMKIEIQRISSELEKSLRERDYDKKLHLADMEQLRRSHQIDIEHFKKSSDFDSEKLKKNLQDELIMAQKKCENLEQDREVEKTKYLHEIDELKQTIDTLKGATNQQCKNTSEWERRYEELKKQHSKTLEDNEFSKVELDEYHNQQLREYKSKYELEKSNLEKVLDEREIKINDLNNEIHRIQREALDTESNLTKDQTKLKKEVSDLKDALHTKQIDLDQLTKNYNTIEKKLSAAQKEHEEVLRELSGMELTISETSSKLLETSKVKITKLNDSVVDLENRLSTSQLVMGTQIEEERLTNSKLQTTISTHERTIKTYKERVQFLELEKRIMAGNLSKLHMAVKELGTELSLIKKRQQTFSKSVLTEVESNLRSVLRENTEICQSYEDKINGLQRRSLQSSAILEKVQQNLSFRPMEEDSFNTSSVSITESNASEEEF